MHLACLAAVLLRRCNARARVLCSHLRVDSIYRFKDSESIFPIIEGLVLRVVSAYAKELHWLERFSSQRIHV